eukprot:6502253-Pyramimonas_sp.AAC.1
MICHAALFCAKLCYVMICEAALCYAMLCCAMLSCAVLRYRFRSCGSAASAEKQHPYHPPRSSETSNGCSRQAFPSRASLRSRSA